MSTLGLILGIVGLVGGVVCPFAFPLIGAGEFVFVAIAIAGIVVSAIGKKSKKGAATAGLVLSIIAVVLSLVFAFACTMGKKAADVVTTEIESALDGVDIESALEELGAAIEEAIAETPAN